VIQLSSVYRIADGNEYWKQSSDPLLIFFAFNSPIRSEQFIFENTSC